MNDTTSDAELVARVRAGEIEEFGTLVSRYENTARAVALKYTRNHHSAEDVVQQAFLLGFEKLQTLQNQSLFGSWLIRIVQNTACNYATRSPPPTVPINDVLEASVGREAESVDDRLHAAIELLNRLPEHERLVMSLRYLDGHSVADIAKIIGRPVGTVTKQLSRAIQKVKSFVPEGVHE